LADKHHFRVVTVEIAVFRNHLRPSVQVRSSQALDWGVWSIS